MGGILRKLMLAGENSDQALLAAVEGYRARNGRILAPSKDLTWLDTNQQDVLYTIDAEGKEKFRTGLYKMFLFQAIENGIKSASVNFCHSYHYRFLEEYLIDKQEWSRDKKQLLEDAELTHFADCQSVIEELKTHIGNLYHQVNGNLKSTRNTHLTFNREEKPIIATPAVEKPDVEKVGTYFRSARYVSILSLLSDVEKSAPFLHLFGTEVKPTKRNALLRKPFSPRGAPAILALAGRPLSL